MLLEAQTPQGRIIRDAMESWYAITFSRDDILAHKHITVQREFERLFMLSRAGKDAAMFSNVDPTEDTRYYLSPKATRFSMDLIKGWSGQPCEPPNPADLVLLVGHSDAWSTVFPSAA